MVREQVDAMMHTVNTQQQQQQQPTVVQTVNTGYSEEDRLPDNPLPTNLQTRLSNDYCMGYAT